MQGAIVSFDEAHSPANRTSVPLPRLNISHLAYNWGGSGGAGNTDRLRHPLAFYEPLPLRFASPALEATPELRAPQFSACTVPVVLFSMVRHVAGRARTGANVGRRPGAALQALARLARQRL